MTGSFVGKSIVIEGDISATEGMVVAGTIRGKLTTRADVQLDESAQVTAAVSAANVTICGQLEGNVVAAGRLELSGEGRLVGDVRAARILFAEGAVFKGKVDMDL